MRELFKRFKIGRGKQCLNWGGGVEMVFREGLRLNRVLDDDFWVEQR